MSTLETITVLAIVYVLVFIAHRTTADVERPSPDDGASVQGWARVARARPTGSRLAAKRAVRRSHVPRASSSI